MSRRRRKVPLAHTYNGHRSGRGPRSLSQFPCGVPVCGTRSPKDETVLVEEAGRLARTACRQSCAAPPGRFHVPLR
eukprot:7624375-Pyramimonas_sp.AAC.1